MPSNKKTAPPTPWAEFLGELDALLAEQVQVSRLSIREPASVRVQVAADRPAMPRCGFVAGLRALL
jgi:hypothetical protein